MQKQSATYTLNPDQVEFFGSGHVSEVTLQSPRFTASNQSTGPFQDRIIKPLRDKAFLLRSAPTNQFDLMVHLGLCRLINMKKTLPYLEFSLAELVRAMNRVDGSKIRQLILKSLQKHKTTYVELESNYGKNISGKKVELLRETQKYHFEILWNEDMLEHCRTGKSHRLDINTFLNLHPGLQSWLYGFITATPDLLYLDIDMLHTLSGANYKNQQDFRKAVKASLNTLYKHGIIEWQHGVTRDGVLFYKRKNI